MRLRFWLGFVVAAAIAVGSVTTALLVHARDNDNFRLSQQGEAIRSARQAEALAALSVGHLAGAAAFYEANRSFDRADFDVLADSLLSTGSLSATAFVQAVDHSERERFERRRDTPIVERTVLGNYRTATKREDYFPLVHAATAREVGLMIPVGYDIGADPRRATHLLRARDKGEPAATGVIRLPSGGTGINVFRPVYRSHAPTATVSQRRDALVGFAAGSFILDDLTAAANTALPTAIEVQLVERGRTVAGPELPREDSASAPLRIADRTWLLVVRDPRRPDVILPIMLAVVGLSLAALLAALVVIWSRNERMQELRRQVSLDPLTGLKNRRRFAEDLDTELARCRRVGGEGALLMIDLDRFKEVNDTKGHPVGDRVIVEVAEVLRSRLRETDIVARLGGDEFGVVLPRCDLEQAQGIAAELARAIREHRPRADGVGRLTASIGIAIFNGDEDDTQDSLLATADAAMYEAKRSGRDRIRPAARETV